jgi:peptide/nickel transport system permease protein
MRYLVKRLLWSIPTLLAVVVIGFVLLVNTPGDPVNTILHLSSDDDPLLSSNANVERQRKEWEEKLGLNLPLFYVTMQSNAIPDSLFKITDPKERDIIKVLSVKTGNAEQVLLYRDALNVFHSVFLAEIKTIPLEYRDSMTSRIQTISNVYLQLKWENSLQKIVFLSSELNSLTYCTGGNLPFDFPLQHSWAAARDLEKAAKLGKVSFEKTILPKIQFHKRSRFHQWLFGDGIYSKGIIRGDFGISYVTREPINAHIYKSLFWSVLFSGIGILLAYLISIPIGIRSAIYNHTTGEKIITVLLFALYSIPVFFFGTLLQTYLANHQHLYLFEPTGIQPVRGFAPGSNWLEKVWQTLPYMVLPIICYTYSSIAFLSRLTKTSVMETLNQPYITTAKAKGLPFKKVIYKHAFRNALIPLVTVFANVFPVLVGGSVFIETIFTIPGMGTEMFNAYFAHNVPVIISIFTLTGIFTVAGFFISDILYTLVDPRIRK